MNTRIPKPNIKPPAVKLPVTKSTSSLTGPLKPLSVNKITTLSKPPPTRTYLSRRSKSAVDLRDLGTKPTFKPIAKNVNTNLGVQPLARKRPAAVAEDVKPKVAKVMKPAPYDYKARYNLLNEKHTKLVESFKELKQKLVGQGDYDDLKANSERLCEDNKCFKEKIEDLEQKNAKLRKEVSQLTERCAQLTVCVFCLMVIFS